MLSVCTCDSVIAWFQVTSWATTQFWIDLCGVGSRLSTSPLTTRFRGKHTKRGRQDLGSYSLLLLESRIESVVDFRLGLNIHRWYSHKIMTLNCIITVLKTDSVKSKFEFESGRKNIFVIMSAGLQLDTSELSTGLWSLVLSCLSFTYWKKTLAWYSLYAYLF